VDAERLGDEQGRKRQVDLAAIQVERVTRRRTSPTTVFEQPSRSSFSVSCGNTDSEEAVPSTMKSSVLM